MKNNKAFTLIELVMVMLIIGILAGVGASILISVVQNGMYSSKALNMDMLAQDALNIITEGDNLAKGLRFSRNITSIPGTTGNTLTFTDQDGNTVIIALSGSQLTRQINGGAITTFPYYASASGVGFYTGRNGALFSFYNAAGGAESTASNVRRVEVNFICRTASGSFADWQGKTEFSTSIRTSKFL